MQLYCQRKLQSISIHFIFYIIYDIFETYILHMINIAPIIYEQYYIGVE